MVMRFSFFLSTLLVTLMRSSWMPISFLRNSCNSSMKVPWMVSSCREKELYPEVALAGEIGHCGCCGEAALEVAGQLLVVDLERLQTQQTGHELVVSLLSHDLDIFEWCRSVQSPAYFTSVVLVTRFLISWT